MRIMSIFGNMRMRMKISCKCKYLQKIAFLGQKWVSLALSSILSAKNIMIVHPFWFYPSSGIEIRGQNHNLLERKKIDWFFTWCELMCIGKYRRMANPIGIRSHPINSSPPDAWSSFDVLKFLNMLKSFSLIPLLVWTSDVTGKERKKNRNIFCSFSTDLCLFQQ